MSFEDNPSFRVVDFDWTGKAVYYPINLSRRVDWANGAEPGALFTTKHDSEMMTKITGKVKKFLK